VALSVKINCGFNIEEAKLIGNKSKAISIIAIAV
jgi:hypothetical protein